MYGHGQQKKGQVEGQQVEGQNEGQAEGEGEGWSARRHMPTPQEIRRVRS